MTLTTERQQFEQWWETTMHNGYPPRFGWEHWRDGDGYRDDDGEFQGLWQAWQASSKLANREAQPVAKLVYSSAMPRFIGDTNEIEGYRCWIHGETRLAPTMEQAYADAKAVCTAPPAPAVPKEMTKEDAMGFVRERPPFKGSVECVQATWNACRAAMLDVPGSI
ncbi:hypothetical protein [Serratia ureilytica]|uniref:hypothetical protein n=1 Tax=Serratia ureilytica TaxID=300181 RepID=UPI00191D4DA6|nr:hypothetical protein [Serratia ureilytica]MBL0880621.1 hypothetical protein [Serratia ureilytica]MDN2472882.1 hypothetical protein [Serratia ureilytica]